MIDFINEIRWLFSDDNPWREEVHFIAFAGAMAGAAITVGAAWIWSFFL